MRGTGEGHYPWDLRPQSTMTNANVEQTAAVVDGQTLTLKYKDGEKKVLVPPDAMIVTFVRATKARLRPEPNFLLALQRSWTTERFRPHASLMARMG